MRKILAIHDVPRPHWVGDGFQVRSLFSQRALGPGVSPFLLLDYAAPAQFPPTDRRRGVGQHPHRGFETVTIVYRGELEHLDSTGSGGRIGPGDVQWMTAASGILHEEFHSKEFARSGGTLEMAQLWVNLPARDKMAKPGYQTLRAGDIPVVPLPDGVGTLRVIAGDYAGHKGPARTFTPMNVWDVGLRARGIASLTVPEGHTLMVVVLNGTVLFDDTEIVRSGETVLLDREGGPVQLEANNDAKLLVLSGAPIDEPVAWQGPFVMNAAEEIEQAMLDFESGRFGELAGSESR